MKAHICLAALSFLTVISGSEASEILWVGGTTLNWSNPLGWEGGVLPGPADTARFARIEDTPIDLGPGAIVKNLTIVPAYIPPSPESVIRQTTPTLGAGAAGSQTLTLLNDGTITSSGYYENRFTINAQLVLGADGGAGAYTLNPIGSSSRNLLYVNGPITGGSGGTAGEKTLTVNLRSGFNYYYAEFNGVISDGGGGPLGIKVNNYVAFSAQNTYSGATEITTGGIGLRVANAISIASEIILDQASLYTGNFDQNFGPLTVKAGGGKLSIIYTSTKTPSDVTFQDSHLSIWDGIFEVDYSFDVGRNTLRFGTDSSALTADQVSRIYKQGYKTSIDDDGYIIFTALPPPIPEPGILGLIGIGAGLAGAASLRKRRVQRSLP